MVISPRLAPRCRASTTGRFLGPACALLTSLPTLLGGCGEHAEKRSSSRDEDEDDKTDAPPKAEPKGKATPNGDPTIFPHGYYDVTGRGMKNDFCQVVRGTGALECDTGKRVNTYANKLDLGYAGTAQMEDANGDGRDDYCRCVGDGADVRYACLVATADGFAQDQYGFVPPARKDCDALRPKPEPAPIAPAPEMAPVLPGPAEVPRTPTAPPPPKVAKPAKAPGCKAQGQNCLINGSEAGVCMDFSGTLMCGNPTGAMTHHDGCSKRGQGCMCSNTGRRGTCNTGPHKSGLYCRCD